MTFRVVILMRHRKESPSARYASQIPRSRVNSYSDNLSTVPKNEAANFTAIREARIRGGDDDAVNDGVTYGKYIINKEDITAF